MMRPPSLRVLMPLTLVALLLASCSNSADEAADSAWQSKDAAEALNAAGYDARAVVVPGGDHGNMVFWGVVDGEWVAAPNDPVGMEVAQIILDAIDAAMP